MDSLVSPAINPKPRSVCLQQPLGARDQQESISLEDDCGPERSAEDLVAQNETWRAGTTRNQKRSLAGASVDVLYVGCCREVDAINIYHFRIVRGFQMQGMKLRHAMVCASNQNRSMEAHALLKKEGLDVSSYGTGAHVKLPGPSIREPNVYTFGTPYRQMFEDLKRKDPDLYKRNGLLQMLKRNMTVKEAPQRWQDNAADGPFDIVLTFEERVFDIVSDDLQNRAQSLMKCALVMNLDVKDNHEEAASGAKLVLELCQKLEDSESWELEIESIILQFEKQYRRRLLYNICFY